MIKTKSSCSYHFKSILYVCTYVDCKYQTRFMCLQCCQPNEHLYHQHINVENFRWIIRILKHHIDELISYAWHCYFQQRNKQLANSFLELNHYLSCLCEWKLGSVIQQNYSNLLQIIRPMLNQFDLKEQNIYKMNQLIKKPNSISDNDHFSFLKIWRKYMMSFALISQDENYLVLGWSRYLAIHQLKDLNISQFISLDSKFNQCQFTQNSRRLLVGCESGLHLYDVNRQFIKIKNIKFKNTERVLVRNIVFIKNNVVLINLLSQNPLLCTEIYKIFINSNKIFYKFIVQDDFYFQYDVENKMIILNNQSSINIYQEFDKRLVICFTLNNNLISQVQYIQANLIIAHCKSGQLLFFEINYKLKQILQIRQINLNLKLFSYNGMTQDIVAQTEQLLTIINCNNFEQTNIPYLMDNEKAKYMNFYQNRMLRQQQSSQNFLITYGRNSIALFKRK